jgi:transposase, IS30 family
MPKSYSHLNRDDRIKIELYIKDGYSSPSYIAFKLNRNPSTISREIKRNTNPSTNKYEISYANNQAKIKRIQANKNNSKINTIVSQTILSKLKLNWSPEQISGWFRREQVENNKRVTFPGYQTIYNYIYVNHDNWTQYLRIIGVKGKYRRRNGTQARAKIREELKKTRIDSRPEVINDRTRLGDFEGDTIVGLDKKHHIFTGVDRKSRYLVASVTLGTSEVVVNHIINNFKPLSENNKCKSLTLDNGVQFARFETIESKLGIKVYFCNPYHSWERGTNENTNGLLRQYYPKKTCFKFLKQEELDKVVNLINSRPRKILNYQTPEEVFNQIPLYENAL